MGSRLTRPLLLLAQPLLLPVRALATRVATSSAFLSISTQRASALARENPSCVAMSVKSYTYESLWLSSPRAASSRHMRS